MPLALSTWIEPAFRPHGQRAMLRTTGYRSPSRGQNQSDLAVRAAGQLRNQKDVSDHFCAGK
jgi:hypothetical protein